MTMTDTEAKALALVNDTARAMEGLLTLHPVDHVYYRELPKMDVFANALCRVIEREASTEARHAAELREQAERFDAFRQEVSNEIVKYLMGAHPQNLAPFILPAPDPLVEVLKEEVSHHAGLHEELAGRVHAAMQARGYEWRKIEHTPPAGGSDEQNPA